MLQLLIVNPIYVVWKTGLIPRCRMGNETWDKNMIDMKNAQGIAVQATYWT